MKTKSIFILLSGILLFALAACEDKLEENPTTSLSKNQVYGDDMSAYSALTGCYTALTDYNYFGALYFETLADASGVLTSTLAAAHIKDLSSMQIQATNTNVGNVYSHSYVIINRTNDVLQNVKGNGNLSEEAIRRITGEASFIRAVAYFNAVRMWGELPLVTEPATSLEEAHKPRSSVEDIYQLILDDLNVAWENLPEPENKVAGRPHKYAAKALLSKVYVAMAGEDESSPYWQDAYNAGKEVFDISEGGTGTQKAYKLAGKYADLWSVDNQNTDEVIFEIRQSIAVGNGRLTQFTLPAGINLLPNIKPGAVNWTRVRVSPETFDIHNSTYPGDPRLEASLIFDSYVDVGGVTRPMYPKEPQGNAGLNRFPLLKKFVDPSITAAASNCSFIYLRYADVILTLAEAANELGRTDEAIGYVNILLKRARDKNGNGVIEASETAPVAWASGSYDKVSCRKAILMERRFELLGEMHEWYDLRRKGIEWFRETANKHNAHRFFNMAAVPNGMYKFPTSDDLIRKNLLFPFPVSEINANYAITQEDQNYGY